MCDFLAGLAERPGAEEGFRTVLNRLLQNMVRYALSPSAVKKGNIAALRHLTREVLVYEPALRERASSILAKVYPKAIAQVASEDNIPVNSLPETCPWTIQQVLDQNYLPSGLAKA